jgi:hypothetical protein
MIYLRSFDDRNARQALPRLLHSRGRYVAGLVGLLASAAEPHSVAAPVAFRLVYQPLFLADAAERSPALPLLAVRAARRAVAENPEDENAYLGLGLAYLLAPGSPRERSPAALLPPLTVLRFVQIVTAIEGALRRNPDLVLAHQLLADLYRERQFLDLSLEHRREELRLSRRAGPRPGEDPANFTARLEQGESAAAELEKVILDRKADLALRSRSLRGDPVRLARLALEMGLARQAADEILLPLPEELLNSDGVKLELQLLLLLGRAEGEDFRNNLYSEGLRATKDKLGVHDIPSPFPDAPVPVYRLPAYEWLLCLHSAAVGDYSVTKANLREIRTQLQTAAEQLESRRRRADLVRSDLRRFLLGELGLLMQPHSRFALPPLVQRREVALGELVNDMSTLAREPLLRAQQADLFVLEGMLDLEQGSPDSARQAFRDALTLCPPQPDKPAEFAGWSIARDYLKRIRQADSAANHGLPKGEPPP